MRCLSVVVAATMVLVLATSNPGVAQFKFERCKVCSPGCPFACGLGIPSGRSIWLDNAAEVAERQRRARERAERERWEREEREERREAERSERDAAEQRRRLAIDIIPAVLPASVGAGPMSRQSPGTRFFHLPGGAILDEETRVPTVVTPPSLSPAEALRRSVAILKAAENATPTDKRFLLDQLALAMEGQALSVFVPSTSRSASAPPEVEREFKRLVDQARAEYERYKSAMRNLYEAERARAEMSQKSDADRKRTGADIWARREGAQDEWKRISHQHENAVDAARRAEEQWRKTRDAAEGIARKWVLE